MSHDCGTRRACAVLLCFAFMAVSNGCRRSPFQRLFDGPTADPPQAAANRPDEIPPLLPVPDSAPKPQAAAPTTLATSPAPTITSTPPPLSAPPQAETFPLSPIADNAPIPDALLERKATSGQLSSLPPACSIPHWHELMPATSSRELFVLASNGKNRFP